MHCAKTYSDGCGVPYFRSWQCHSWKGLEAGESSFVRGQFALIIEIEIQQITKGREQGFKVLPVGLVRSQSRMEGCIRLWYQTFLVNLELVSRGLGEHILALHFCHLPLGFGGEFCIRLLPQLACLGKFSLAPAAVGQVDAEGRHVVSREAAPGALKRVLHVEV